MSTRLATQARLMEQAIRDIDRTDDLASRAWRAVDSLSLCPTGCLAMNRAALLEMQERIEGMLSRVTRGVEHG